MKDYLVFSGENYYPCGGWEDFRSDFDSLEEGLNYIKSQRPQYNWAHVVYKNKIIKVATTKTQDFKNHTWEFEEYQKE
jgi:hypothetical protein